MKLITLFEKSVEVKGYKPEDFVEYMRSTKEVKDALAKYYGKASLMNVARLFSEHNMAIADNVVLNVTPDSIYPFREYDREPDPNLSGWTGKMEGDEYENLKVDIERNGIKNPLMLELARLPNGNVDVKLGEGNHRLRIARELNIKAVPLRFYYRK